MAVTDRPTTEALIARHIGMDPTGRGPAYARLSEYGTPVWALIGYLQAVDGNEKLVAQEYEVPVEARQAALAYYHRHRAPIDALILLNAA
jgi:hypothetical protein